MCVDGPLPNDPRAAYWAVKFSRPARGQERDERPDPPVRWVWPGETGPVSEARSAPDPGVDHHQDVAAETGSDEGVRWIAPGPEEGQTWIDLTYY